MSQELEQIIKQMAEDIQILKMHNNLTEFKTLDQYETYRRNEEAKCKAFRDEHLELLKAGQAMLASGVEG